MELLIVAVILGVLTGLAVPRYFRASTLGNGRVAISNLQTIRRAQLLYYLRNEEYEDPGGGAALFEGDNAADNYSQNLRLVVSDRMFDYFFEPAADVRTFEVRATNLGGNISVDQDGVVTADGQYAALDE